MKRYLSILLLTAAGTVAADVSPEREAAYQTFMKFQNLVIGGRVTPNWMPDGSSFWIAEGGPNDRQIMRIDPAANSSEPLFDTVRLRAAIAEETGQEPAGQGVPFKTFYFAGPNSVAFALDGINFTLDLDSYALTSSPVVPPSPFSFEFLKSEAERTAPGMYMRERFQGLGKLASPEAMSPDGKWVAGVDDNNLTLRGTIDGMAYAMTEDGTDEAFWDVEAALWRPWSPDGRVLAVTKQYADGLPKIPTIKWLQPLETVTEAYTIPAGSKLYRAELYLFDVVSRRPLPVDLGDTTDKYVRIFGWTPDSSELIVALYNRVLSAVDIVAVNGWTREVRPVLSESSETFLTNHHEAIWAADTGFNMLPDGSGFIWNSERSGWDHLYLYDINGKLQRQLTDGDWPVVEVQRIDQEGGWVYFSCHRDQKRPYDTHLCRVGLDGRGLAQLTEGEGMHSVNISPSNQFFTDTYSSVNSPPRTELRTVDGELIDVLAEADVSRLEAAGWVPPREYVVKAADGETDLWVTVYFPNDFESSRKYPVVEYIYAGPQTTWRPMDFGDAVPTVLAASMNFPRALAQLGFIVVSLDARGTPERSKAFHDTVYMNWGQFEIDDHAGALRQLGQRLPFIDLDRVGIMGGSWGGHFTFRALTQASDVYKAGISSMPGYDSRRFTLYETYLGMPQDNPAGYDAADALNLAPQLKGALLQIGGINDTGTQADVFKMSELLIRLGKQHEMFIYPNTGHGVIGATGRYDLDLKKRFFIDQLNPGSGGNDAIFQ